MDALWDDSNILPRSPRPERAPLFLASPSASPEKTRGGNASNVANPDLNEIDSLFADIDNLEAPPPRRIKRVAETDGKKKSSRPSAVNVLLSEDEDEEAPNNGANDTKTGGEEDGKKKARKKPVKLDENRLLGNTGFPALIEQHKRFRPSGKGNEAKDLKRLLQMYQFWAVKMYPRSDFRETAEKVEKLCRSRRMQNALNSFKNDLTGGPRHEIIEDAQDVSASDDGEVRADKPLPAPVFDSARIDEDDQEVRSASSRPSTSMSAIATTSELDDLIATDLAERRAALERDRARQSAQSSSHAIESNGPPNMKIAASTPMDDDWDLDALLAEEDEAQGRFNETSVITTGQTRPTKPDFDVDVGVNLDVGMEPPPTQSELPERGHNVPAAAGILDSNQPPDEEDLFDEDEDMWNMINDVHAD